MSQINPDRITGTIAIEVLPQSNGPKSPFF